MKRDITSALDSTYVIDGIRMDLTPKQILQAASIKEEATDSGEKDETGKEPVVDESTDPAPYRTELSINDIYKYAADVAGLAGRESDIPAASSADISRIIAAQAIIDTLWKCGHFRVSDLLLRAEWRWDFSKVDSYASFYSSVESTCWYTDMMGIRLGGYSLVEGRQTLVFTPSVAGDNAAESFEEDTSELFTDPFTTTNPVMEEDRKCPDTIVGKQDNWLIYIPFDTCSYRLGGSLIEEAEKLGRGKAPEIGDTDYFMDCFEVVREFVEDGIVLSGRTVGRGGLMTALGGMCQDGIGAGIELGTVMQSYGENDLVNILFGEIPGVVIEISSSDFDYVDAELLLQDVAYYPLGHPGGTALRITGNPDGGISGILQSLIENRVPEGED
ncbi:MAG: AIR synthase-related protein [Candidatus Cryptobacteroides sp.]